MESKRKSSTPIFGKIGKFLCKPPFSAPVFEDKPGPIFLPNKQASDGSVKPNFSSNNPAQSTSVNTKKKQEKIIDIELPSHIIHEESGNTASNKDQTSGTSNGNMGQSNNLPIPVPVRSKDTFGKPIKSFPDIEFDFLSEDERTRIQRETDASIGIMYSDDFAVPQRAATPGTFFSQFSSFPYLSLYRSYRFLFLLRMLFLSSPSLFLTSLSLSSPSLLSFFLLPFLPPPPSSSPLNYSSWLIYP